MKEGIAPRGGQARHLVFDIRRVSIQRIFQRCCGICRPKRRFQFTFISAVDVEYLRRIVGVEVGIWRHSASHPRRRRQVVSKKFPVRNRAVSNDWQIPDGTATGRFGAKGCAGLVGHISPRLALFHAHLSLGLRSLKLKAPLCTFQRLYCQ